MEKNNNNDEKMPSSTHRTHDNNKNISDSSASVKKLDNFLQLNATSLITSPLQFHNDHVNNYPSLLLKRSIEPYCTVRKPRKMISFSPEVVQCKSDFNKSPTTDSDEMGNNQGHAIASTEDEDDESEFENSQDSTNRSLLKDFSDNDSCLDGIVLSRDDPSTLSGPDYENWSTPVHQGSDLKFEDNFLDDDDQRKEMPMSNYCTVRQKPKAVNPHDKIIAAYGTIKRKLKNQKPLTNNEEELFKRISLVNTFDCDEQVKDYLKELDAYLDEMDYSSSTTTTSSSVDDLETAIANDHISPSNTNNNHYAINSFESEPGSSAQTTTVVVEIENNESCNSNKNSNNPNNNANNSEQQIESDLMAITTASNCNFNVETNRNNKNINLQPMANINSKANNREQLKKYVNNPFCTLPKRQKKVNVAHNIKKSDYYEEDELNGNINTKDSDEDDCGVFRKGYSMRLPARPKLSWSGPHAKMDRNGKWIFNHKRI